MMGYTYGYVRGERQVNKKEILLGNLLENIHLGDLVGSGRTGYDGIMLVGMLNLRVLKLPKCE